MLRARSPPTASTTWLTGWQPSGCLPLQGCRSPVSASRRTVRVVLFTSCGVRDVCVPGKHPDPFLVSSDLYSGVDAYALRKTPGEEHSNVSRSHVCVSQVLHGAIHKQVRLYFRFTTTQTTANPLHPAHGGAFKHCAIDPFQIKLTVQLQGTTASLCLLLLSQGCGGCTRRKLGQLRRLKPPRIFLSALRKTHGPLEASSRGCTDFSFYAPASTIWPQI